MKNRRLPALPKLENSAIARASRARQAEINAPRRCYNLGIVPSDPLMDAISVIVGGCIGITVGLLLAYCFSLLFRF